MDKSISEHIASIRKDYSLATLDEAQAGYDPIIFFQQWFIEAEKANVSEVNAMTLATVDIENKPHARIVLLKGLDASGFSFFTNYESDKAHQIKANQHVALLFFWKELQRQVRIEGVVKKIAEEESIAYFKSRPKGSQLSAVASPQSQEIDNRKTLEDAVEQLEKQYQNIDVPKPIYWGGYVVKPYKIEFWQGRHNRLHDRIVFEINADNRWSKYRIAP